MSAEDPYAAARDRIQETVKWLASILSGVTAALGAGIALTGFPALQGAEFETATWAGAFALLSVLFGLSAMLQVLLNPPLYFGQIAGDATLKAALDAAGEDLFPIEAPTYDALARLKESRAKAVRDTYAALPPENPIPFQHALYRQAEEAYNEIIPAIAIVTSFANLLRLHRMMRACIGALAVAALVGFAALSVIAFEIGEAAKRKAAEAPPPACVALPACKP